MTTIVKLADGHYIVPKTGVQYDQSAVDDNLWFVTPAGGTHCNEIDESEGGAALGDYLESVAEKPEMGVSFCHEYDCKAKPPKAFTGERGIALALAAGWVGIKNNWGEVASWYCPVHTPKQGDTKP